MKNSTLNGFTLIEMAVVMAVIALIAGAGLGVTARLAEKGRMDTTIERMEHILLTIEQYVDQYGQLPCPAGGQREIDSINFGVGGGTDTGTCTQDNFSAEIPVATGRFVVGGVVPFGNLGLSHRYLLDGWNRKITYIVSEPLTADATWAANTGEIDVQDAAGNSMTGAEDAAVAIISHGPNGHGAWDIRSNAQINANNEGTHEQDNDMGDTTDHVFRLVPFNEGASVAADHFDDIVMFRTKWQLDN